MRSSGTVRALRSLFCQPAPLGVLLLLLLLVPAFSGCLSAPLQETGTDRQAGASAGRGEPGAVPEVDWRYKPPTDRRDGSPYGVHLSWLEAPETTLSVTWFTAGTSDVAPVVEWGPGPLEMEESVSAESHKAFGAKVMVHGATIRGLDPETWVHYRACGSTGCSGVFDAKTAPPSGSGFRFGLLADHGTEHASLNATGTLLSVRPDFVVLAGDISYADGSQSVWDDYFHMHEPLFARVPIMAVPGNHEYRDGQFYDSYRSRFTLPNDGLWYGFSYSDVHFTFLEFHKASSTAGFLTQQTDFFRADLAQAEANKATGETSFHFVVQHMPLYSNHHSRGDYRFNINLQEALLLEHHVDFLLVGHDHFYERSHPRAFGLPTVTGTDHFVDPEGYIQVTNGGGGRPLGIPLPVEEQASWTATNERRHQITEFHVTSEKVTGWTLATDGSGDLLDHFSLTRTGLP